MNFGAYIRGTRERLEKREGRQYTLRQVALRAEIAPNYLSRIERDLVPPPSEESIVRLAKALGEDVDELLSRAGRVASDVQDVVRRRPKEVAGIVRALRRKTTAELNAIWIDLL